MLGLVLRVTFTVSVCVAYAGLMGSKVHAAIARRRQHRRADAPATTDGASPTAACGASATAADVAAPADDGTAPSGGGVATTSDVYAPTEDAGQRRHATAVVDSRQLSGPASPTIATDAHSPGPHRSPRQRHALYSVQHRRHSNARQVRAATLPLSPRSARGVRVVSLVSGTPRGGVVTRQVRLVSVVPGGGAALRCGRVRLFSFDMPCGTAAQGSTRQARLVTIVPTVLLSSRHVRLLSPLPLRTLQSPRQRGLLAGRQLRLLSLVPRALGTRQGRLVSVRPAVGSTRQERLATALHRRRAGRRVRSLLAAVSSARRTSPAAYLATMTRQVRLVTLSPRGGVYRSSSSSSSTRQVRLVSIMPRLYRSRQARLVSLVPTMAVRSPRAGLLGIARGLGRRIARLATLAACAAGQRKTSFPHLAVLESAAGAASVGAVVATEASTLRSGDTAADPTAAAAVSTAAAAAATTVMAVAGWAVAAAADGTPAAVDGTAVAIVIEAAAAVAVAFPDEPKSGGDAGDASSIPAKRLTKRTVSFDLSKNVSYPAPARDPSARPPLMPLVHSQAYSLNASRAARLPPASPTPGGSWGSRQAAAAAAKQSLYSTSFSATFQAYQARGSTPCGASYTSYSSGWDDGSSHNGRRGFSV